MTGSQQGCSLEASARRAGAEAWLEQRLFELLGRWSAVAPHAQVRAELGPPARHHAWHAELWLDLLPAVPHLDPDELVVPEPGMAAVVARLEGLDAAGDRATVRFLVGAYRVLLPRKLAAAAAWGRRLAPATDGPTRRALELVRRDELEEWQSGEARLQALLTDAASVEAAAAEQAALERALLDARSAGRAGS